MSFVKRTWQDRQSEYPTRRKLVGTSTNNVYDVEREEGEILSEGDAFSAENMNDLESRIDDALGGCSIKVVDALPATPDANTIYLIKES